jgi:ATP-dependent DNA helicase RecQ
MKSKKTNIPDIADAARRLLGFHSLRPGQQDAISSLIEGRDTLVVQPTGSGKSAIYQIAGALLPGSTLVVSPLIALQKDQADAIEASKLEQTAVVNSTLTLAEQRDAIDRIDNGDAKYIFLAPEQLRKPETLEHLQSAKISLIAIDEAHCISQWGHDFRPDYLELGRVIEALGHPPTIAMTATASPEVRAEIVDRLGLHQPRIFVRGFDRPNISLRVDTFPNTDQKCESLMRRVEFADKPGIVYASTHKGAESLAADLLHRGVEAVFYHGGLKAKDREAIQNRFMAGDVPVMVATNAFGMGVDKSDIRFVYHADVSDSLDAYYQEIGRAGRDGEPAEAVLFFCSRDIGAQQFKTAGGINTEELESVAAALANHTGPMDCDDLGTETGLSKRKLTNLVHKLEEVGAATQLESGEIETVPGQSASQIIAKAKEQQHLFNEMRKRRLEQMRNYSEGRTCRRQVLLQYFGEESTGPCGHCDRCESMRTAAAA